MQPGQTITPQSSTESTQPQTPVITRPVQPVTPPTPIVSQLPPVPQPVYTAPAPAPLAPEQPTPQPPAQPVQVQSPITQNAPTQPQMPATPSPFESQQPQTHPDAPVAHVTWTASEYIAHAKSMSWFVLLGVAMTVLVIVVYFVTKDILASVLVGLAGITFGVFAARPPQVLTYSIDSHGIQIGKRSYQFNDFKSFALTESGHFPSVLLMPLKRFLPPITMIYDPKEEDAIINALADYLPHEEKEPDMVDRLMSRIRF